MWQFAVPLALAGGGYLVDKYGFGGNGMTGAGAGLSLGMMGADGGAAAGAGAGAGASSTVPSLLVSQTAAGTAGAATAAGTASTATNAGAIAPTFFDKLSLGAGGYDATAGLNSLNAGSNLMSTGGNVASNAFTLPTEFSNVLDIGKEYAGKAYDYVDEGLEGMSFSDKLNVGALGYSALGQQDPTMQRVTNGEMLQSQYQNPSNGLLDISVAGPSDYSMTAKDNAVLQNQLTPEQLAQLGLL